MSQPILHAFGSLIECFELIHEKTARLVLLVNMFKTLTEWCIISRRDVILDMEFFVILLTIDTTTICSSNAFNIRAAEPEDGIKA